MAEKINRKAETAPRVDSPVVRGAADNHESGGDVAPHSSLSWHAFAAVSGVFIAVIVYVAAIGQPVVVKNVELQKPKVPVTMPGGEITVSYTGYKPWWARRLCIPTGAALHVVDVFNTPSSQRASYGFNDNGDVKSYPRTFQIPKSAAPGEAAAYESIIYKCLGVFDKVYHTPRYTFTIAELPKTDGSTGGASTE